MAGILVATAGRAVHFLRSTAANGLLSGLLALAAGGLVSCGTTPSTSKSRAVATALREAEQRGWRPNNTEISSVWSDNEEWYVLLSRLNGRIKEDAGVLVSRKGSKASWFPEEEVENQGAPIEWGGP